jgi:indolepyruvate ferredoxin oxidoreductase alpha subunit
VADAAILCPSFFQADVVHNPTNIENIFANIQKNIINFFQMRRQKKRLSFIGG